MRVRFADFRFDSERRELTCRSQPVHLPPKALLLLETLLAERPKVVRKQDLQQRLWPDVIVDEANLANIISELRSALGDDPKQSRFIRTAHGYGYSFIADASDETDVATGGAVGSFRSATVGVGLFLLLLIAAAWFIHPAERSPSAHIPFRARDWVLITAFENRTGEAVFDEMLSYAVEREISESQYVNVVPRPRINDALALMRRPASSRVDVALGREICLRDGSIRALIGGRIAKETDDYVLTMTIVDPLNGATVASFTERASGRANVTNAIRRCSGVLRERLGETRATIRRSDDKLVNVTTPSLEALQLYSKADAMIAQTKSDVAEELLKQAIAEDPQFASAYIHLAHALRNQRRPKEEYLPFAKKALDLSKRVSDRERYFIRGGYYSMSGELEKAKSAYEALLTLFPDHPWANQNLYAVLTQLGQESEAATYAARSADVHPQSLLASTLAAQAQLNAGRLSDSDKYLRRAQRLATPELIRQYPFAAEELISLPVQASWARGDFAQTLRLLSRGVDAESAVDGYLLLGRLHDAELWAQRIDNPAGREADLAMIALDRGDRAAIVRHLLNVQRENAKLTVQQRFVRLPLFLAEAGLVSAAEQEITALERQHPVALDPPFFDIAKGQLAIARGRRPEGILQLQRGVNGFRQHASGASLVGAYFLARALEDEERFREAAAVLEPIRDLKIRAASYCCDNGAWWMRAQLELSHLYRRMGRVDDAQRIEAELRGLLSYADADHVIARQVRSSPSSASTSSASTAVR